MTKLKELRIKKGLIQEEVSTILGVTRSQYSRLETGSSLMNESQIKLLSVLYEVSTDELLEFNNENEFRKVHQYVAKLLTDKSIKK